MQWATDWLKPIAKHDNDHNCAQMGKISEENWGGWVSE